MDKIVKSRRSARLNTVSLPSEIIIHILLTLFCLMCIVPFIFVIIISFSSQNSISEIGYSFFPKEVSTKAYKFVFDLGFQLVRSFFNSVFISVVGTIISVLICIMYSYAMFRKEYKYRTLIAFFSFFTMMFSGGLAPTYMISKDLLGLDNNYAALIVPLLVSPFNFIIMRTFFQSTIHMALIESASIDGSSEFRTLFQIVIPIAKPGIATIALLNIITYWNEWFLALLYLKPNSDYTPLQYLLYRIQDQVDFLVRGTPLPAGEASRILRNLPGESLRMALVVLIVIPIAFAYPFFQRYIISGLTIGSVKG